MSEMNLRFKRTVSLPQDKIVAPLYRGQQQWHKVGPYGEVAPVDQLEPGVTDSLRTVQEKRIIDRGAFVSVIAFIDEEAVGNAIVYNGIFPRKQEGLVRKTVNDSVERQQGIGVLKTPLAQIERVFVAPENRERGIGSLLLAEALAVLGGDQEVIASISHNESDKWLLKRGFYESSSGDELRAIGVSAVHIEIDQRFTSNNVMISYELFEELNS